MLKVHTAKALTLLCFFETLNHAKSQITTQ